MAWASGQDEVHCVCLGRLGFGESQPVIGGSPSPVGGIQRELGNWFCPTWVRPVKRRSDGDDGGVPYRHHREAGGAGAEATPPRRTLGCTTVVEDCIFLPRAVRVGWGA